MSREGTGRVDDRPLEAINRFARDTPGLHVLVNGYASYGIAVFALRLLTGWWTARHSNDPARMATALCAGAAVLVAVALNQPIVHAVARPRPYTTHHDLLVLAPPQHRSVLSVRPRHHGRRRRGRATAGVLAAGHDRGGRRDRDGRR
jgi:hypothetical protein